MGLLPTGQRLRTDREIDRALLHGLRKAKGEPTCKCAPVFNLKVFGTSMQLSRACVWTFCTTDLGTSESLMAAEKASAKPTFPTRGAARIKPGMTRSPLRLCLQVLKLPLREPRRRARALAAPVVRCRRWRWVALVVNPRGTEPGGLAQETPAPDRPGGRGRRGGRGGGNRATHWQAATGRTTTSSSVTQLRLPPGPHWGSDFRPPVGDSPPRHPPVLASITRRHDFERGGRTGLESQPDDGENQAV